MLNCYKTGVISAVCSLLPLCKVHNAMPASVCSTFAFSSQPENILLDDAGNVKLTDFGFATILQEGETLLGKRWPRPNSCCLQVKFKPVLGVMPATTNDWNQKKKFFTRFHVFTFTVTYCFLLTLWFFCSLWFNITKLWFFLS